MPSWEAGTPTAGWPNGPSLGALVCLWVLGPIPGQNHGVRHETQAREVENDEL